MRKWFLNFQPALLKRKINIKFLLASLKALTNSKDCSQSRIILYLILFRLSFSLISTVYHCTFMAGFRNKFQSHRRPSESRNKLHEEGYWKYFLLKFLIESTRHFILDFLHKKTAKSCKNHQRSNKKYCFDVPDLQKIIHLVPLFF